MNKQTAVKILRQHFSLFDIQSWMGECSFIDKAAMAIYPQLVAENAGRNPDDVFDVSAGITVGRYLSTQAYKWAAELVLAKLRFDNRERTDLKNLQDCKAQLAKLVELKVIKTDMENGTATPEQQEFYAQTKDATWLEARRLIDG